MSENITSRNLLLTCQQLCHAVITHVREGDISYERFLDYEKELKKHRKLSTLYHRHKEISTIEMSAIHNMIDNLLSRWDKLEVSLTFNALMKRSDIDHE